MKYVVIFCILLGSAPSIMCSWCLQPPIHSLPSACSVRNLTVFDSQNRLMTNDYSCNASVNRQSFQLDWPNVINFTLPVRPEYSNRNSSFLLTLVDNTAKQLLWMVANITASGTGLFPLTMYSRAVTIKPYQTPTFNATHREHELEYLVFRQKPNFQAHLELFQPYQQVFNLTNWLDRQITMGTVFCGPVAGALVRVYDVTYYPPNQAGGNNNLYPTLPPNNNNGQNGNWYPPANQQPPQNQKPPKKNSAFRFCSNISVISAIALLGYILVQF